MDAAKKKSKKGKKKNKLPETKKATPATATSTVEKNVSNEDWTKEEDVKLLEKIRSILPANDRKRYESRASSLKWESVAFGSKTPEECKQRWGYIQDHLRHYRLMRELVEDGLKWTENPWLNFNKGAKANKQHPDHPKVPMSAYLIFFKEKRDKILKKNPEIKFGELSGVAAKLYHALSEKKKQKYLDLARIEKEKYNEKLEQFKRDHPDCKTTSLRAKTADPPTVPTPYNLYCDANMKKLMDKGMSRNDARLSCKESFKSLSDKKKLHWIDLSLAQEKNYMDQFDKFLEANPDSKSRRTPVLNKEEESLINKRDGKPEKPPGSGFTLYCSETQSKLPEGVAKKSMAELSTLWKTVSEEKKAEYQNRVLLMKIDYQGKYAAYLKTLPAEKAARELMNNLPKALKRKKESGADVTAKKEKLESQSESDESDPEPTSKGKKKVGAINASKVVKESMSSDDDSDSSDSNPPKTKVAHSTVSSTPKALSKPTTVIIKQQTPAKPSTSQKISSEEESSDSDSEPVKASPQKKANTSTISKPKNGVSSSSESDESSEEEPVKPSPPKKINSSILSSPQKKTGPIWTLNQKLYKNEPPKPPKNPAKLYAMDTLKSTSISEAKIKALWNGLDEKKKKKLTKEHNERQQDYETALAAFKRGLNKTDLQAYESFRRDRLQDSDLSSSEEDDSDEN